MFNYFDFLKGMSYISELIKILTNSHNVFSEKIEDDIEKLGFHRLSKREHRTGTANTIDREKYVTSYYSSANGNFSLSNLFL